MSRSAKVTSIDAIAEFKVAVHKFADELRDAVTTFAARIRPGHGLD